MPTATSRYAAKQSVRSTNGATKLREPGRTESASYRLSKPYELHRTTRRRYRTQEVAGSSPASSTSESPLVRGFFSLEGVLCIARNGPADLTSRRGCVDPVPARLVVQRLGGHVEAAGPGDRSCLRVDFDAREVARVIERFEDAAPLAPAEVDLAHGAIAERPAQPVGA